MKKMKDYDLFEIGESFRQKELVTEDMINNFANVTGDRNPIHLDKEYAANTFFKKRIVHGFLYGSFISKVLGTRFPGFGTIYLSQEMKFIKPVYINDKLVVEVKIIEKIPKQKLKLETKIYNQENDCVLDGRAIVSIPK